MKPARYEIHRRMKLSYEEFAHDHLYPLQPVIITDVMEQWPALRRWSPEFFKKEFGHQKFSYYGADYDGDTYETKTGAEFTLTELIDRVLESTPECPAPYFRNKILSQIAPSLMQDIQPLPEYFLPNWLGEAYWVKRLQKTLNRAAPIELFIGGRGGSFPVLHYDGFGSHAFLMQIYGCKEFIIYPPEQELFLYPSGEQHNLSSVNVSHPDFERFPLFGMAVPTTFVLEPGEMLFIPCHWWHTTRMLTPSITLAATVVNQSNWHELRRFFASRRRNQLAALASQAYLFGAGAWRSWRDRGWRQRVERYARSH